MVLLRVTLAFLVLILLPDWYIYKVYVSSDRWKWFRRVYWIPAVSIASCPIGFCLSSCAFIRLFWYLSDFGFGITVPKAVFVLSSLFLRGVNRLCKLHLFHGKFSLIPAFAVCLYIGYGAIWGKENFRVKEVAFTSPDLPETFDGYRILQLSDIHAGSWKGNSEALGRAINLCNALQPDVVVFTGDLVNSHADEIKTLMPVFSRLKAKDGVYSVLGNHDYATYRSWRTEAERLANVDTLIARQNKWDGKC